MAEVANITLCTYIAGSGTFDTGSTEVQLAPGSPDWFSLGLFSNDPTLVYEFFVDPVPTADVYTIYLLDADENPYGWITVTIQNCPPDEEHNVCMGSLTSADLAAPPTEEGDTWVLYEGPDWFTLNSAPFEHSYSFIPNEIGTVIVVLQAASDPEVFYRIQINITNCFIERDGCQKRRLNISWFLPEGGWKSYVFYGKKLFGVDIGSASAFKDEDEIAKFNAVNEVRDTVDAASGSIPKSDVDYVKLLKPSIQAFLYNDITAAWDIPIVIEKTSFQLYRESDTSYKYDFKFSYGKEIKIQTQ